MNPNQRKVVTIVLHGAAVLALLLAGTGVVRAQCRQMGRSVREVQEDFTAMREKLAYTRSYLRMLRYADSDSRSTSALPSAYDAENFSMQLQFDLADAIEQATLYRCDTCLAQLRHLDTLVSRVLAPSARWLTLACANGWDGAFDEGMHAVALTDSLAPSFDALTQACIGSNPDRTPQPLVPAHRFGASAIVIETAEPDTVYVLATTDRRHWVPLEVHALRRQEFPLDEYGAVMTIRIENGWEHEWVLRLECCNTYRIVYDVDRSIWIVERVRR